MSFLWEDNHPPTFILAGTHPSEAVYARYRHLLGEHKNPVSATESVQRLLSLGFSVQAFKRDAPKPPRTEPIRLSQPMFIHKSGFIAGAKDIIA